MSEASRLSGVSERLINYGKCVREYGIEQLKEATKDGKVAVKVAAQIAKLTPAEQRKCIENEFKLPKKPKPKTAEQKSCVEDVESLLKRGTNRYEEKVEVSIDTSPSVSQLMHGTNHTT